MPFQAKTEPLEALVLDTAETVFSAHNSLYGMGYRGALSTTENGARIDLTMANAVSVNAALGDVILYRTSPAVQVVKCLTMDEFTAGYDTLP